MLRSTSLHAYMFRSPCFRFYECFPMSCASFCSMLMLGLHVHMLNNAVGYALLRSMCLCTFFHVSCIDLHLYMLILGFLFFHAFMLAFTCLDVHSHAYMSRSMLSYACVLGYMFSTCFMLSSMCLCTPCHVCVPRPRLCLSCHVLL